MQEKQKRRRIVRAPEEILQILADYKQSGMTQVEFARSRDIHASVLGRWIRHNRTPSDRRAKAERRHLIAVRIKGRDSIEGKSAPAGLELSLRSGIAVRVPQGFDPETLSSLLDLLEGRC